MILFDNNSTIPVSPFDIILLSEFDIILQSNPNLQYDLIRTYKLNILCSDGRTSVSNVFYVNVLRNRPPSFINLQSEYIKNLIPFFTGTSKRSLCYIKK